MITSLTLNSVAVFLCTYLIHSTLLLGPVWWLTTRRAWPGNPELRNQLLKSCVLAPLFTTIIVMTVGGHRWGLELPLIDAAVVGRVEEPARDPAQVRVPPRADFNDVDAGILADRLLATESFDVPAQRVEVPESALRDDMLLVPAVGESSRLLSPETVSGGTPHDSWWQRCIAGGVILWFTISLAGLVRLAVQWVNLQRLRSTAESITDSDLLSELDRLRNQFGIRREVAFLRSGWTEVPLAAGILRPCVVFPMSLDCSRLKATGNELAAMLSHELAHVVRRDAMWNLLLQCICRVGFFQPLNLLARDSIRRQMDFCADSMAAEVLGERMSLVRCLYQTGERLNGRRAASPSALVLASGMSMFHSTLGLRVEALLSLQHGPSRPTSLAKLTLLLLTVLGAGSVGMFGPHAVLEAASFSEPNTHDRKDTMQNSLASFLLVAGLSMPATADEPAATAEKGQVETAKLKSTPDALPEGIRRFNGMLVGRIAARDVEQGTFTVLVDAVPRVWENSRAEDPRSVVGKTVQVSGVFGKFLDVLVVTRIGETVEFECKHDGEGLVFPGELLRKVAPYDPADYPVLPEEFRGFRGRVVAEILKKDPETFELIVRVDRVLKTWEESSARDPKSIEGKSLMLAGFWNRREAYHELKVGDRIDVGMKHIGKRSDHLTVAEAISKNTALSERPLDGEKREMAERERMEQKDPQRGFRGMLVGRLVEKDAERGTFTITVDAVPRVWENNRSGNPKSLIGKKVSAEGVTGRMIDALVVTKIGDTIEFGALHEEGPRVRVGEVLRKVAPVKPGDYPVLPDSFRGFRGMVTAKVIRKGDELWELIVEVEQVHETFEGNRATDAESIVGKQLMLAGFWNRKDQFHEIRVGDRIRCGMRHTQVLSDHLSVVEGIRRVGDTDDKD